MRCEKPNDRDHDPTRWGHAARLGKQRADSIPAGTPSEVPLEIAIILSSAEDGLARLRNAEPDLDGVRNLLRVIALAAGSAIERAPWRSGAAGLDTARLDAPVAAPAAAPLALSGDPDTRFPALGVPEVVRGGLSRWQQKRVVGLMARLDQDTPTVSELAAACRLSSGYFIKAFKQTFGVTPRRWRQLLRIEHTKSLLASNDLPIAEIALVCGFADQSHLTRVFSQIVGVPPARWRRRCVDDIAISIDQGQVARRRADWPSTSSVSGD